MVILQAVMLLSPPIYFKVKKLEIPGSTSQVLLLETIQHVTKLDPKDGNQRLLRL